MHGQNVGQQFLADQIVEAWATAHFNLVAECPYVGLGGLLKQGHVKLMLKKSANEVTQGHAGLRPVPALPPFPYPSAQPSNPAPLSTQTQHQPILPRSTNAQHHMKGWKDMTNTATDRNTKKRKCIELSIFSEITKFDIECLSAGDMLTLLNELGQSKPNNGPARLAKLTECFDAQGEGFVCKRK